MSGRPAAEVRSDEEELTPAEAIPIAGDVALRVIATVPNSGGLFRLDQLIAAAAQERLWLTDAYFVGVTLVRPGAVRGGTRRRRRSPARARVERPPGREPDLARGLRVRCSKAASACSSGTAACLHAKSAVADERWARVGSTNLNLASWLTNYELDVAIEDERYRCRDGRDVRARPRERDRDRARQAQPRASGAGSGRGAFRTTRAFRAAQARAAAGAMGVGAAVGAALTNRRTLGPADAAFAERLCRQS